VKSAQTALIEDQGELGRIDSRWFSLLNTFLHEVHEMKDQVKSLADLQQRMVRTLDDVWAREAAKDLKGSRLPAFLKVAQVLLGSAVFAKVAELLFKP